MRGSVQFVTAARDIKGIADAPSLARRLTLVGRDGQLVEGPLAVIQFSVPRAGLASPIRRSDPGFSGYGRTAGGSREFVVPNLPLDELPNKTTYVLS